MKKLSLLVPLSSFLLFGCGEETTNVTETTGPTSVAKFKDLAECTDENEGDFVYVKDSAAAYLCADGVWNVLSVSAADGSDGKNGENGTSCTATVLKDKSGFELTCGGKVIGIISNGRDGKDGKDGADGKNGENGKNGEDGTSCEGKKNKDGSVTISCGGKEVATIKSGDDGNDGKSAYELSGFKGTEAEWLESLKSENCTIAETSNGVEVTCDGITKTITNGTDGNDGTGCSIKEDKGGVVTLQCGEGESAVETKLYKAMCGTVPFDPGTHFCYNEKNSDVVAKCAGRIFDPQRDVCGDDDSLFVFCYNDGFVDQRYNVETSFCYDEKQVLDLCDGKDYDPTKYECVENIVQRMTEMCGAVEYNLREQFCAKRNDVVERVYKKVTIGTQTWMAENLNYETASGSFCYNNNDDNCATYGRLYNWSAANAACPDGWHLPTNAEWETLIVTVDGSLTKYNSSNVAGKKLKATILWKAKENITNEDAIDFAALPAGGMFSAGDFMEVDRYANFWSASQSSRTEYWAMSLSYETDNAYLGRNSMSNGFSVRCLQD